MRRDDSLFEYRPEQRLVLIPRRTRSGEEVFELRIPARFGPIHAVERRGDYLVVRAETGKTSYHLVDTRINLGAGNRVGYMVWNSLRKTIRSQCLAPRFAKRVDMHVLYFRNGLAGGSGSSDLGVLGRVTLDKRVIVEHNALGFALGPALERYLHLEPHARLRHEQALIRAFALLDRDTQELPLQSRDEDHQDPLWAAFHALRCA